MFVLDPPGLVGGEFPAGIAVRPAERLAEAPVSFDLPPATGAGPLRRLDIHIATWKEPAVGTLTLSLRSEGGPLAAATVGPEAMVDNGWASFDFPPGAATPPPTSAELSATPDSNVAPYVVPYGHRVLGRRRRLGAIAARAYYGLPEPPTFPEEVPALTRGSAMAIRTARALLVAVKAARLTRRVVRRPGSLPREVHRIGGSWVRRLRR